MTREADFATTIAAVESLASVIEDENRVLATFDFSRSADLAEAKRAAIVRMEDLLGKLTAFPADQRVRLAAAQTRLDSAIVANRELLRTAIETQQRVISTVVQGLDVQDRTGQLTMQYGQAPAAGPIAIVLRA